MLKLNVMQLSFLSFYLCILKPFQFAWLFVSFAIYEKEYFQLRLLLSLFHIS